MAVHFQGEGDLVALQVVMMLATRFQPRLQTATGCRAKAASRTAVVRVVAFKDGEEHQTQKQELSKAKVTFQLPLHVEWGQEVALVGAVEGLGNWEHPIPMCWNDGDVWTTQAELPTNTVIEYKYVIRAGEGEVKAVVEWQPCNNLELQAEQEELTIRDAWEGQQHDILAGTLPLPEPAAPEPEPVQETAEIVAAAAAAAAPAPVAAEAEVKPAAAPAVEVAAAPAPAPATRQAAKPDSPAAAVAAASAPVVRSTAGHRSTTSRNGNGSKPSGGNSSRSNKVVAAAATEAPVKQAAAPAPAAPSVRYGSLSTSELKVVCKERGLSANGQRKDLLARLQQLLQQQGRQA